MGHEIFFKIFDGPQNIFLCAIFVILFLKLRGLEHKISKLAIKEIYERQDMLYKSHPLSRYKEKSGRNKNPGHVTFTSWIFFEIFTSGKYHRDMKILKISESNST